MKKLLLFPIIISVVATTTARAENPDLNAIIGTSEGYTPAFITNDGIDWFDNASTYNLSMSSSFAVDYGSAGYITGRGYCSTRAGDESAWDWGNNSYELLPANMVDNLTNETGQTGARYCYCKLDKYVPSGGSAQSLTGPWVYVSDMDNVSSGNCTHSCFQHCMDSIAYTESDRLAYRAAVFSAYPSWKPGDPVTVTTQTYVDNALNAKQAKITTTGTNKLMTYGASTGATPGSRDIVSTLGTSTTATTVPETGPIVAGIANKQDAVNGTANYIMTGTGTPGTVGEKAVYSTTNNYSNALVEAQTVNTAATTAANSEMSCHTYASGQSQTPANCLLWQINTSGPTILQACPSVINLTELIGTATGGHTGGGTNFSINYNDNKGVITGQSRCSTQSGTTLTTTPAGNGSYCWCRLDTYTANNCETQSLSYGPWVFLFDEGSFSDCNQWCRSDCPGHLSSMQYQSEIDFRTRVFNAY